ncbi:MAG: helix-turn-helix transcriptional regulator [Crocinitomicaceae bacterium]|nr:helix-turn-helix transcriptional regulator [Crocinitomicaceae bacterium]
MSDLSKDDITRIQQEASLKLGQRIREIREQKGLTQTELAHRIQSDRQYLYKIEFAKIGVSFGKTAVIAKALGVSVSELAEKV